MNHNDHFYKDILNQSAFILGLEAVLYYSQTRFIPVYD